MVDMKYQWMSHAARVCLLIMAQMLYSESTTNNAELFCLRHHMNNVKMTLKLWNVHAQTPITNVIAVNQDTDATISGCSSSNVISGAGTTVNPMTLTIIITDVDAGTVDNECGHKISGNKNYTWKFRITTSTPVTIPGLTFGSIGDETFMCPFDTVLNPTIADSPAIANSPGSVSQVTVTPSIEELQMSINHPTTNEKILVAQFASDAILQLRLVQTSTGTAVGLTGVNCLACPTSACDSDTLQLISSNGCEVSGVDIFETSSYSGFYSKRDPGSNIGSETVYSNVFKIFRFSHTDFVYIKCSILYCFEYNAVSGNPYCDDHCTWSGAGKRRKRRSEEQTQSSMSVIRVAYGTSANNKSVAELGRDSSCLSHPTIRVAVPCLAAVSAVVTAAAFVSCALLHKIMHSRQKPST